QSACLPIRPMSLSFNAPVPRALAARIRLKSDKLTLEPHFEGEADADSVVDSVKFKGVFPERTEFSLELPSGFKDASGRPVRNAENFPLKVSTGPMPPLAKFAASPFGIVERFAEPDSGPLLPVTLRNVEPALRTQALTPGRVGDITPRTDAEILGWLDKVARYEQWYVARDQARADVKQPLPRVLRPEDKDQVEARMLSLLAGQPGVKTMEMPRPAADEPRPFEVVGIPMTPGFHVVEIASPLLGKSLLDERYGGQRTMYVRTTALVTNLAVHFKLGRENAMAWVTTLDKGTVVAGAQVRVSSCDGKQLATGVTNAQGVAELKGLASQPPRCFGDDDYRNAYFVSARAKDAKGVEDLAFTFSDWYRGIEPWRFNLQTSREPRPDRRYHAILDRPLLRAGETVSLKHLVRTETRTGFGLPDRVADTLVITHTGSGQEFVQPLQWRKTATGGMSAENQWQVPPAAKLGQYQVTMRGNDESATTGSFRVEEFRLPVLEGRIAPTEKKALIAVTSVPTDLQVNYVSGGGAVNLPVRVSALVQPKSLSFGDYEEFSFRPPRGKRPDGEGGEEEATASEGQKVIADKLPVTLDRN
ncbi:MAG: alpha-2-macroglobulin, partial [Comamonadaceae bacterium]